MSLLDEAGVRFVEQGPCIFVDMEMNSLEAFAKVNDHAVAYLHNFYPTRFQPYQVRHQMKFYRFESYQNGVFTDAAGYNR